MKSTFLAIKDHSDLAVWFDLPYSELSSILYQSEDKVKYKSFEIAKKSGGFRLILAPNRQLKNLQKKLGEVLYDIYPGRPSAYGFVRGRNIVDNAEKHLDKRLVFNLDLEDYFGTIHFGRVRNLFLHFPFKFNYSVATILAQLVCFRNQLPQGAPTSPILSNMISFKLDSQLQALAKRNHATYTRYADDITFSFTCKAGRLPSEIVRYDGIKFFPGETLSNHIQENGFKINNSKTRMSGKNHRQEVTGLTVNEFPNVPRKYIRQISSMLHAWEKFGYEMAEREFNEKYDSRKRATETGKSLKHVLNGKLSFLRSVRGGLNPIFNKYADWYNTLVDEDSLKFRTFEETDPAIAAREALWVIQILYDDPITGAVVINGTGFMLKGYGLMTCAHVVLNDDDKPHSRIEIFKHDNMSEKYIVEVIEYDIHRDLALCEIQGLPENPSPYVLDVSHNELEVGLDVTLLGFPAYSPGQTPYVKETKVASIFPQSGVDRFEIAANIRKGISGGPIIDSSHNVIGLAQKGATQSSGKDSVISSSEFKNLLLSK